MPVLVSRNGQQAGPFEEDAVRQMLQQGQLSQNDMGIRQGDTQWQPLGTMFAASEASPGPPQFSPGAQANLQSDAPKSGKSKGCLYGSLALGAVALLAIAGFLGFVYLVKQSTGSGNSSANTSTNSNVSAPKDFTAIKDKAEELAGLQPTVKPDPKVKLKGRIAIVQKGKFAAEMKGFDADYKSVNEPDLTRFNLTKEMLARTPEEIDSLVQIICKKGIKIGKYEGNIDAFANSCKVSLIDYRSKTAFAEKTLVNIKLEKSVSSDYDDGDFIVIPPNTEIAAFVASFAPETVEVSSSNSSALPNIDDPKTFAASASNFGNLSFPLKTDGGGTIKGKVTIIQTGASGSISAMMIGLDSDGNIQKPLPEAIVVTKESLGFRDDQIARRTSEIGTLIQVTCKKGSLVTKVKGISVFANVCTVSIIDYKGFATIGQKTFEGKKINNERYSDPSMYDDKQDIVEFPRTEVEEFIKSFPKA